MVKIFSVLMLVCLIHVRFNLGAHLPQNLTEKCLRETGADLRKLIVLSEKALKGDGSFPDAKDVDRATKCYLACEEGYGKDLDEELAKLIPNLQTDDLRCLRQAKLHHHTDVCEMVYDYYVCRSFITETK